MWLGHNEYTTISSFTSDYRQYPSCSIMKHVYHASDLPFDTKHHYICTYGGLCNRLRVIFSYVYMIRNSDDQGHSNPIIVFWPKEPACNGKFTSFWKVVPNCTFVEDITFQEMRKWFIQHQKRKTNWQTMVYTNKYHPWFQGNQTPLYTSDWIYSNLELLPEIQQRVQGALRQIRMSDPAKFIAIHVRRTDKEGRKGKRRTAIIESIFKGQIEILDSYSADEYKIYLAADNRNAQEWFFDRYDLRIRFANLIKPSNNKRKTPLEDAVLDLYICIHAVVFIANKGSTFSKFIEVMRSYNNHENSSADLLGYRSSK